MVSDGLREAGALEGFIRKFYGLIMGKAVEPQWPIDEIVAVGARREGIELRAVTDLAEELDGLLGREAEDVNRPSGRLDQAGEQVHQGGLARTVGADEAGDSRLEREIHFIHAENFSVKLGDIVENDLVGVWRHPRTVSRARKRALRMKIESKQTKIREPQAAGIGISFHPCLVSRPDSSRNPCDTMSWNT